MNTPKIQPRSLSQKRRLAAQCPSDWWNATFPNGIQRGSSDYHRLVRLLPPHDHVDDEIREMSAERIKELLK